MVFKFILSFSKLEGAQVVFTTKALLTSEHKVHNPERKQRTQTGKLHYNDFSSLSASECVTTIASDLHRFSRFTASLITLISLSQSIRAAHWNAVSSCCFCTGTMIRHQSVTANRAMQLDKKPFDQCETVVQVKEPIHHDPRLLCCLPDWRISNTEWFFHVMMMMTRVKAHLRLSSI